MRAKKAHWKNWIEPFLAILGSCLAPISRWKFAISLLQLPCVCASNFSSTLRDG